MSDLRTTYLGLQLRSPIVASAGPLTGDLDRLAALDAAGVGAVVLPSLFEEQIEHETSELDRLYSLHRESFAEATTFLPEPEGIGDPIDDYLSHVEAAAARVEVPVIASLNGIHIGGWLRYARLLQDAGADALEINLYSISADPAMTGAMVEAEQLAIVEILADEVTLPVAVKISPHYASIASFVVQLQEAGAAGVVMFNRFYLPDLDIETLEVEPRLALSTPEEVRLPLRWIGILREHLRMSMAATTGIHSGGDVVKVLLAGADVAMTTSALLRYGPSHVATMEEELRSWMEVHEYDSVDQMRGAVRREASADPEAYERANYIGNLAVHTSRFLGEPRQPTR